MIKHPNSFPVIVVSHHWNRPKDMDAQEKFDVKDDYKMQEICVGFEMDLPEKKLKNKICTLCYGTGNVIQPNGVKVACPKGCPGFYPPHR